MGIDEKYMQRCIELARLGAGEVSPNPMVGCVIVHEGKVIAEGFHQKYGEAHAEKNAIDSVANPELLKKCTLYVSLEPCAHYGKTPPCAELIVSKEIPSVVIGTADPFAKVAGKGIQILENAGIRVKTGILEAECRELNKRFFTYHEKRRPYIILKWAQTQDGFIGKTSAGEIPGKPVWISNSLSRRLVHKMRAEEDAVLVGAKTAAHDNPTLNVRDWKGRNPVRLVIDRELKLPRSLNIFGEEAQTIVFTGKKATNENNITYTRIDFHGNIARQIAGFLFEKQILSVIVEGGAKTLETFLSEDLWDEAQVFCAPAFFGSGTPAPKLSGTPALVEELDECRLFVFRNK